MTKVGAAGGQMGVTLDTGDVSFETEALRVASLTDERAARAYQAYLAARAEGKVETAALRQARLSLNA